MKYELIFAAHLLFTFCQCLNVGFYNTGQSANILESVNDISGTRPPSQQTAQITALQKDIDEANLDILCLSDLLLTKQIQDYQTGLANQFQYSFSQIDVKPDEDFTVPRTPCTADDYAAWSSGDGNCSQDAVIKCDEVLRAPGTNILDFQICLAQSCPLSYQNILYSECKACINIFAEANNWDPNTPGQALGLAMYACSMPQERVMNFTDGTLILSKYPIVHEWSVPIASFIFYEQRLNVVQIDVDDSEDDVFVACVTMNPTWYKDNVASYVAVAQEQMDRGLKNHIELNEMQIESIVQNINDIIGDDSDLDSKSNDAYQPQTTEPMVLLMGDLGTGQTWHEENFALLTYEEYDYFGGGACTFCVDEENDGIYYNSLAAQDNSLFESNVNKDLDHVLLRTGRTHVQVAAWSRFMTQRYQEENDKDAVPFSTRWGVMMELVLDDEQKDSGRSERK